MPNSLFLPIVSLLLLLCTSCDNKIVKGTTPLEIFDAFWKIMDERYVYFPERNIDWDSVYHANYPKVKSFTKEEELVPIFQEIIDFMGDRHCSITINQYFSIAIRTDTTLPSYNIPFNKYGFNAESPIDYSPTYRTLNGITAIPNAKHPGIVYLDLVHFLIPSIETSFLEVIQNMDYSKGLIIDVRRNPGGYLDNCIKIVQLFYNGKQFLYYQQCKKGPKHTDFSEMTPIYSQGVNKIPPQTPVVLLISPYTYSGGNLYAFMMKDVKNCVLIGERTAGGGSVVQVCYLPNGWIVHYSFNKQYNIARINHEFGLAPDIYVPLQKSDTCDYQVLKALEILK